MVSCNCYKVPNWKRKTFAFPNWSELACRNFFLSKDKNRGKNQLHETGLPLSACHSASSPTLLSSRRQRYFLPGAFFVILMPFASLPLRIGHLYIRQDPEKKERTNKRFYITCKFGFLGFPRKKLGGFKGRESCPIFGAVYLFLEAKSKGREHRNSPDRGLRNRRKFFLFFFLFWK